MGDRPNVLSRFPLQGNIRRQIFATLEGAQQDRVLIGLEEGAIKLEDVSGKDFSECPFAARRSLTTKFRNWPG
jgi:hypothetical protein